jgi:hypothetical protein
MVESLDKQEVLEVESLSRQVYGLYLDEYSEYSGISPSLHRLLQHSRDYVEFFQSKGLSIGQTSEQGQEATNGDSKYDRQYHSYRGSHLQNNIDCFNRSWWASDPYVLRFSSQ